MSMLEFEDEEYEEDEEYYEEEEGLLEKIKQYGKKAVLPVLAIGGTILATAAIVSAAKDSSVNGISIPSHLRECFEKLNVDIIFPTETYKRKLLLDQWYVKPFCCTNTERFGENLVVGFEDVKFSKEADNWCDLVFDLNHEVGTEVNTKCLVLYIMATGDLRKKVFFNGTLIFDYVGETDVICKGKRIVLYSPEWGWLS